MKYRIPNISTMAFAVCCAFILAAAGCGSGGGGTGTASATFVLANGGGTTARDATEMFTVTRGDTLLGPVPVEEIESLTVTVTEIVLQRCGPDDDEEGADELETVLLRDFEFDPMSVTIEEGGTVRWVWTTDTLHTITSGMFMDMDAGSLFDESAMDAGTVIELIFADTGNFPYFSDTETDIAEGMVGNVNVVPEDDANGDDDDDDNGNGNGGHVTIFTGSFDVELKDLSMLAQVINEEEIPAARYCKIRIRIENPRLVLASDPETELMNVKLTANGRLFIQDRFELEPGEEVLILIDFGGLHLVDAGSSGMFVLTPQLRADVGVTEVEVEIEGVIISKDDGAQIIEVQTESDDVFEVIVSESTMIFTDDDSDDGARSRGVVNEFELSFDDLAVDQNVIVEGTLMVGDQIAADSIEVEDDDIDTTMLNGGA